MARTYPKTSQLAHEAALSPLGVIAATPLDTIIDDLSLNTDTPLRITQNYPSANSRLYISSTYLTKSDGAQIALPNNRKKFLEFPTSYIDFATKGTSGGTFDITWPSTSTATSGKYRRLVLAYTKDNAIKGVFSIEYASVATLPAPDTLFPSNTIPIGYVDLETVTDLFGHFRTAGSATAIIENSVGGTSRVIRVATGGAGGSGSGVYSETIPSLNNSDSYDVGHGLESPLTALKVILRNNATGYYYTAIEQATLFTITNIDNNTIRVLNNSAGTVLLDVFVVGFKYRITSSSAPTTAQPSGTPTNISTDLDPDFDTSFITGQHTNEPTGIETPSDWDSMTFTDVTPAARTFSVTLSTATNIWIKGVKNVKAAGTITGQLPTNTAGLYYIYFTTVNATFTISAVNTPWNIATDAPLALVYWDGTKGILYDERHGITMDGATHTYLHNAFHTQFASGLDIIAGTYALNTASAAAVTPAFNDGIILDEDISIDVSGFDTNGATMWTPFYRAVTTGTVTWDSTASPYMWKISGTNVVWNNPTGWALTSTVNNDYVNIWILSTDEYYRGDGSTYTNGSHGGTVPHRRMIPIIGQAVYTTLVAAQAVSFAQEISTGTAPSVEWLPAYRVTIRAKTADSGNNYAQLVGITDIRKVNNPGSAATGAGLHNTLAGRSDASAHPSTAIDFTTIKSSTASGVNFENSVAAIIGSFDETGLWTLGPITTAATTPRAIINTGTSGATDAFGNITTGQIIFANEIAGNPSPVIASRTDTINTTGLTVKAYTANTNSTVDMKFVVLENDGTDFATLTNKAFQFFHNTTDLGYITRAGNWVIPGDFTVNGTTTTINTTNLEVTDNRITINKGGILDTVISGIDVEVSAAPFASILFNNTYTSKWGCGLSGTQKEIVTVNDIQSLTNKTIDDALTYTAITTPTAVANKVKQYAKSDAAGNETLYALDENSIELPVSNVNDFRLCKTTIATDSNVIIYAGYLEINNGEILATATSTTSDSVSNIGFDLTSLIAAASMTVATYWLYIDRYTLPTDQVLLTDTGLTVRPVNAVTHFALLLTSPTTTNPYRYVPVGFIKNTAAGSYNITAHGSFPVNRRDLMSGVFAIPQVATKSDIVTATSTTFAHNLFGEPQTVYLSFYDSSTDKKYALDVASYITDKNLTSVTVDTTGLTFDTSDYVELKCIYLPQTGDQVVSVSNRFESGWYSSVGGATIAHGLTNIDDIRSYCVLEWDVTNNVRRVLEGSSALISSFDNTNFNLDWSAITPTATLQYKIISGGTPLPSALPIYLGGYTKFVGGIGGYSLLSTALSSAVSGDSILVTTPQTLSAADLAISTSDIRIDFMPNCPITFTGNYKIAVTGNNVEIKRLEMVTNLSVTTCLNIAADDCFVDNVRIKNTSGTITTAFNIASGNRNYINGKVLISGGTAITTKITDAGTDSDYSIRG